MTQAPPKIEALVAGEWRGADDDSWIDVLNPADVRCVVARVPALSAANIGHAYGGAVAGARIWRATNALERGQVLLRAAALLRERSDEIATDLVREMGKTLAEATVEVAKSADFFEFYGGLVRLPCGYLLHDARANTTVSIRYEPVGVVLAITPWNDPLLTPARKLAPALAAGNAVILKPASDTPLVALHLARALTDAGLPAQVISTVTGRGRDIGGALLADRHLDAVSFTGSTQVGIDLQRQLAGRNVRMQTEMGGKNPSVVLADANLDLAAQTIAAAAFAQAGQRCTATSRVIAERRIADELTAKLTEVGSTAQLGPGLDPETTLGPVVNAEQRDQILRHIREAEEDGARIASGGGAPAGDAYVHGCYVEPTVVVDVTRSMGIWRDEIFGPVVAVHVVDGFDEAIEAANDTNYGLSAAIFTTSLEAATRFMNESETGQVAVNLPTSGWDVHQPFGGFRDSGSAFKEQGVEALRFYTRVKTCAVRSA
ncbi:MAG: aldehyde dehydrogenase family protein [Solirubrobacteraceae bacterium]